MVDESVIIVRSSSLTGPMKTTLKFWPVIKRILTIEQPLPLMVNEITIILNQQQI